MKLTLDLMTIVPVVLVLFGDMRNFIVTYTSERNLFKGQCSVNSIESEQKDKFFDWLKKQAVYPHMWNISINFEEIGDSL